jgi:hypothetical protein
MCKYNSHYYWENTLLQKEAVWQSSFAEGSNVSEVLFLNTTLIDYPRQILDNDWACYPNSKYVLGFLQYIYLPLAFYFTIHKDVDKLFIPISTTGEFIVSIQESGVADASRMIQSLEELSHFWRYNEPDCRAALCDFCQRFNTVWQRDSTILHIGLYTNTNEIARRIISGYSFPELLIEDIGYTPEALSQLCEDFYTNPFIQKTFIKLLNNNIGCIV